MKLPEHIVKAIETYIPPLEGWTRPERACELAEVIIDLKPKVVVEIGTFGGRSAIAMAFALRENNNKGKLYAIDPWRVEYALEGEWKDNQDWYKNNIDIHEIHERCMIAIWQHNLDEWLVVIRAASQHCFKLFPRIDVLLIDGNHSEVASFRDARLYVPNVRKGGMVMIDDLDWQVKNGDVAINSTAKAKEFIEQHCELVKQSGNMGFYRKK
jgi:predicted O-methyltransferase YrrM